MKKYYLILVLLFMAGFAWAADDDLYCCGQKQTSLYNWKYTPTNNINGAIQMGSISYDAASKTVTFDGAYATVTGDNRIFYNKNVPGLKIVFKGYCRLRSEKCVFRLDKDTQIQGSTELVELQGTGDNAQCIYCPNETELTITDAMKMSMISKYWRAMETSGTTVKVTNSRIYAQGADCAIHNNKGNDQKGYLGTSGCFIRDTWLECNGSVGGDPYIFNGYYNGVTYYNDHRVHTSPAKSVMIILEEDWIGVRLKGIALTKGWSLNEEPSNPAYGIEDYYTYDESTKTLTLKKDIQAPGESDEELNYWNWEPLDYIGMIVGKPITIDGGGHAVYGEIGMRSLSDVTLSNIIVAGSKTEGIENKGVILTLKDDVIVGGVENAISGSGTVKFNPSGGKTVMLVPCNDKFRETSTFGDKPVRVSTIRLVDCTITTPEDGVIGTSGFEVDGNTVFSKVVVTGTTKYDLWIGDTQVTSLNASDILGDGGHFRYNPSTNVLRVTNATLENTSNGEAGRGIYNKINNLTVTFVGDNTFTTSKNAIRSTKSITLTGIGSFTATSAAPYTSLYLEDDEEDITCTIDGLQVDLTGEYAIRGHNGSATLNVTGSSTRLALHPADGEPAITELKALNLGSGLYISEPIGGYFNTNYGYIELDDKIYYGDVVISNVQNRKLGIRINGTEMTTLNMNNVPGVVSGNAYVTLNSNDEPTLVLENATLECDRSTGVNNGHYGSTFNIIVVGDCTITGKGEMFNPLYLDSETSTTIKGGGTLNLISANESDKSGDAIYSGWEARLTLTDYTTVIAKSIDNSGYYDENDGRITIDSGYFCAYSEKWYPLWLPSQFLLGQGVDLRYPAGGQVWGNYVYGADGAPVQGGWVMFGYDTQVMDELITGVSPIMEKEEGAAIYNLAGQRLSKPQKGINIIGEKKYIVK